MCVIEWKGERRREYKFCMHISKREGVHVQCMCVWRGRSVEGKGRCIHWYAC